VKEVHNERHLAASFALMTSGAFVHVLLAENMSLVQGRLHSAKEMQSNAMQCNANRCKAISI